MLYVDHDGPHGLFVDNAKRDSDRSVTFFGALGDRNFATTILGVSKRGSKLVSPGAATSGFNFRSLVRISCRVVPRWLTIFGNDNNRNLARLLHKAAHRYLGANVGLRINGSSKCSARTGS
jgi:hypothetical protein